MNISEIIKNEWNKQTKKEKILAVVSTVVLILFVIFMYLSGSVRNY